MSQSELFKQDYKEFYGKLTKQIPKLIAEKRTPISVYDLIKKRLEKYLSSDDVKAFFWCCNFNTIDGFAYHPDGKAKVILDAQLIREINPESEIKDGALILTEDLYKGLNGLELNEAQLEKYANGEFLERKDVTTNPIWQFLARDIELLFDYTIVAFSMLNERYKLVQERYPNKAMALFRILPQDIPIMHPWSIEGLESRFSAGPGSLNNDLTRTLGILKIL